MSEFKPYVPANQELTDFTVRTVVLGVILGALFGSANAYLGLRVGLTISTSIPLAVVSVAVLRLLTPVFGKTNILACNISQTAGSASSSLASGIIFTIPALFMWGYEPSLLQITMLAVCGGVMGVLLMIPLRPYLIVKEHKTLPYPEGTAAAEVLMAASGGGSTAKNVFVGLGLGAVYKGLINLLYLWPDVVEARLPFIRKAVVSMSTTPALLGVGYILGRRIGAIMVGGGLLSWVVIIPFIAYKYGDAAIWDTTLAYLRAKGLDPSITTIGELSPGRIWDAYIRIIGAGAVAAAGIITVIKSIPTMAQSLRIGVKQLRTSAAELNTGVLRTERDLPLSVVLIGIAVIIALVTFVPGIIGSHTGLVMRFVASLAIAIFAFCFVTVSSRIVGMIGVTSNPTSGMAIVTLLGTGAIFWALGWTDLTGKITALTIGTIVCVAASISGDISQDLKCGYIIGATPRKQQTAELIGAAGSAFFVCLSVFYLGKAYGFGSDALPAPQATLMKTVLDGVLGGNLRWDLVGVGAAFAVLMLIVRIPPLPFAVGMYLPLETMTPVFVGGLIRHFVDQRYPVRKDEQGKEQGVLLGSGFIAGEGLMGVVVAVIAVVISRTPKYGVIHYPGEWMGQVVSLLAFTALGWYLMRVAAKGRRA
ncbi:MAG: oligopeptide transporter, OPT family [Candidatus Krumholzibacteria bacterium]|nr:oligopeptide transporter, OPT family [Candidatus Krumholzibacteria bacterium]MDH4338515.1 oligopeptide transporter, OPT family [Candidatus Krumholzibacteria bacterium]MDH5269242.1 oligopeptide transporter, OPT family [Candidatus Krumholzibacteria bacterium]